MDQYILLTYLHIIGKRVLKLFDAIFVKLYIEIVVLLGFRITSYFMKWL